MAAINGPKLPETGVRPNVDHVDWVGATYPLNADPERDSWNGKPLKDLPPRGQYGPTADHGEG